MRVTGDGCLSENRTYLSFIHFLLVHVSVAVKTAPTCTTNTMITTGAFGRFWHKSNFIGRSAPQIINLALLFLKILRNFAHNYLFSAVSRKNNDNKVIDENENRSQFP